MKKELFNLNPSNDIIAYQVSENQYETQEGELRCTVTRTDTTAKFERIGQYNLSFYECTVDSRTLIVGTTKSTPAAQVLLNIHNLMREDGRFWDVTLANTVVSNDLVLQAITILDPVTRARNPMGTINTVENNLTSLGFTPASKDPKRTLFYGLAPANEISETHMAMFLVSIAGELTARARMEMDRMIMEARSARK